MKGKYGLSLSFYAVLAFVLAVFDQTLWCFLLLGFVMVAENNVHTSKQVMEATLLSVFHTAVKYVLGWISGGIISGLSFLDFAGMVSGVIGTIFGALEMLVAIAVLVFAILAIVNVVKGKDAKVPGIHALANKLF